MLRLARIPRLYRLLRIFRLIKLFRVFKLSKLTGGLSKTLKLGYSIKQTLFIFGSVIFITHLVACFWFFIDKETGFSDSGWVVSTDNFYESNGRKYVVAFHWAF